MHSHALNIVRLHASAVIPRRATHGSVGYDLAAVVDDDSQMRIIHPGTRALIGTGLSVRVPRDTYGRIAPRSSLATKWGIQVGAGVVDPDYTGELKVLLFNHGTASFIVRTGDVIAQLVLERVALAPVVVQGSDEEEATWAEPEPSELRRGGFGSTDGTSAPKGWNVSCVNFDGDFDGDDISISRPLPGPVQRCPLAPDWQPSNELFGGNPHFKDFSDTPSRDLAGPLSQAPPSRPTPAVLVPFDHVDTSGTWRKEFVAALGREVEYMVAPDGHTPVKVREGSRAVPACNQQSDNGPSPV